MKLYLSSYKFGNHREELIKLAGENKKAVVIMNAVDYGDYEHRQRNLQNQIKELTELGFEAKELDLRDYFNNRTELQKSLKGIGLIWIHGGNVFILQRAFEQSGLSKLIKDAVEKDQLVYAGFSAAVCLAAPTLKGTDIVDDPNIVPERYEKEFSWEGLGFIDYNVAVHYKSDHPESADTEREVAYYKQNGMPFKTLRDGEVIILDKGEEKLLI